MAQLVLASGSPRRAKILRELGLEFEVVRTDAPEVCYPDDPVRTVRENALLKGDAARHAAGPEAHILSADTIVWFDGRIYGKPRDLDEAAAFLRELSGREHTVFTGVAFDGEVCVMRSGVRLRDLDEAAIAAYIARVNPIDRAGAYDIDTSGEAIAGVFSGWPTLIVHSSNFVALVRLSSRIS